MTRQLQSARTPTPRLPFNPARGGLPVVILPLAVLLFAPQAWPGWAFMWALAFAIYAGCKWLTWRNAHASRPPAWRHAAYLLAWPGLDADAFLQPTPRPMRERPAPGEWLAALIKTVIGVAIFWNASRLTGTDRPILLGWLGMAGIVLALHFGLFHLLSCLWRSLGINAKPLMRNPLASVTVAEFWGKRWNTAFRDLTHRFLFRPLIQTLGPGPAILVGFTFSGLIHDLVISVPARGGYGGPTLFFIIQAAALLFERSAAARSVGITRREPNRKNNPDLHARLFTAAVLVLPIGLLFHPPFIREIILPFMHATGAL